MASQFVGLLSSKLFAPIISIYIYEVLSFIIILNHLPSIYIYTVHIDMGLIPFTFRNTLPGMWFIVIHPIVRIITFGV